MGVEKYIYDTSVLTKVIADQKKVRSELQEIYSSAKGLKKRLEENEGWNGKQKEILLDLLEALINYHGDVTGGKDGINNSPYDALIAAMNKLEKKLNGDIGNISAYKEILNVW